ncbi:MAG: short-chain dehydrogenase [Verrucomicrobia bacterium]|nr:MAG: short-chain dehydrogenase [Verrucomicrobiota bacterium]
MAALDGKVIVVVGGTTGLGLSAACALIGKGARVVVVGRKADSASAAQTELGDSGCALIGDAADPDTAAKAIAKAESRYRGFHGLYHVAGGSGRRFGDGPAHRLTAQGIRTTLMLNLESLMLSNQAAIARFLDLKQRGTILNMGSVLGFSPSPEHFGTHAYAAAKAGIIGFSRSAAAYYAPMNIRINVVAPGLVETPMARRAAEDEEILSFISNKQPLDGGRIGRVEDLDEAAVYFLSDASSFVTGQVLAVDGGWSVSEGRSQTGMSD